MKWKKHIVIPDTQVRPGLDLQHFVWIGRYIADKQPEEVIHLGDHWDFPSLCEYDRARVREFHSRSYQRDLEAGARALQLLDDEIGKAKGYVPRKTFIEGNHDYRATRLTDADPRLRGAVRVPSEIVRAAGWRWSPFLRPTVIDGVAYCHLFAKSSNGLVTSLKYGAPNARTQVLREMRSCTAGHKPGLDSHIQPVGNGSIRGIIAGSCYRHNEDYHSPQGHNYWRGILVKHEVHEGRYDLMEVSLDYLKRRYS